MGFCSHTRRRLGAHGISLTLFPCVLPIQRRIVQITQRIAVDYGPKHSKGMHSNFPLSVFLAWHELLICSDMISPSHRAVVPHPTRAPLSLLTHLLFKYSKEEQEGLKRTEWYFKKGSGYVSQQTTQPQTLGYTLADSPVGLLAWIYEKLVLWTDNYPWHDDEGTHKTVLHFPLRPEF